MSIERLQIVGFETSRGISKKTGKPYAMGQLHVIHKLADPLDGNVSEGFMGCTYSVDSMVTDSLAGIKCPFWADVNIESVMRFGQRQSIVLSATPVSAEKPVAKQ